MGSDAIALPLLEALNRDFAQECQFVGVYTQPDRPTGRGQKIEPNQIKRWATKHEIPIYQPEKFNEEARISLAQLNPDMVLVMAYGHILKDTVIQIPKLGTFNLHTSLLPKYRGASPIQTAIAEGERESGVSLMKIVRELDAGPVADQEKVVIEVLDTALDLEHKLALASVPLVTRNLSKIARKEIAFTEQDKSKISFCRRLRKEDQTVDFNFSASSLASRINGLNPWPSASFYFDSCTIKIGLADYLDSPKQVSTVPGTILGSDDCGLLIQCNEGTLRLRKLQRPGGRMLSATEFLRGYPVETGVVLESKPMRALVSDSFFT
jgi:methionyl-tRNA formyltransferase